MPQEILDGVTVMPSADIFSLGLMLYEISLISVHPTKPNAESISETKCDYTNTNDSNNTGDRPESSCDDLDSSYFSKSYLINFPPYEGRLWHELRQGKAAVLKHRPENLRDIIQRMMSPTPSDRPSAEALIQHDEIVRRNFTEDTVLSNNPLLKHGDFQSKDGDCSVFQPISQSSKLSSSSTNLEHPECEVEFSLRAFTPTVDHSRGSGSTMTTFSFSTNIENYQPGEHHKRINQ
jgi:serine/threonine protein kinase